MKKRFLHRLAAFLLAFALAGCAVPQQPPQEAFADQTAKELTDMISTQEYPFVSEYPAIDADLTFYGDELEASVSDMAIKKAPAEVRMVWISFLEMEKLLTNKSEAQFRKNMQTVFKNCNDFGINTVVIQVRPYADALYKSDYFPWSFIISGTEGKDPGFDPFKIMVSEARSQNLRIEAWINPYRIRPADRKNPLAKTNQAKKWLDEGDNAVIEYKGVISYNPASTKAQNLIVNGAVELVKKYDIDGIHIDDYFYPTTDAAFDKDSYNAYKKSGGTLALADWRRSNVETLIKKMYSAIKKVNSKLVFGISPQSSLDNNYSAHYLDVQKIAANRGYCDYLCPQIYFAYNNERQPYAETLEMWDNMVSPSSGIKLYVGLAAYKVGVTDTWAGNSGKNEWVKNTDLLKRMTQDARKCENYGGVGLYRYDFLFSPPAEQKSNMQKEVKNLKELFK